MALFQNLVARLSLDSKAFESGAKRSRDSMRGLQRQTLDLQRAVVGLIGTYIGARGLVRAYASVTKAAMDAEESENLFTVSMGKSAKAARQWSKELGTALGLNEYTLRQNIATFNVMFESMGLGTEQAYEMAAGLTRLAYDIASFYNLKPEEAFQKLQSGITGQVRPLRELGIIVNETTIQGYALKEGWIKQGEALSETGKLQARYNVIVGQTSKAQGDLARTITSATNVQRRAGELWKQAQIDIGTALLPTRQYITEWAADFLTANKSVIQRWASDWIEGAEIVRSAFRAANEPSISQRFLSFGKYTQEKIQQAYESQTGGRFGYYDIPVAGSMGGGATVKTFIPPADETYARRLMESYARQLRKAYGVEEQSELDKLKGALGAGAISPTGKTAETVEGDADKVHTATADIAAAYRRMSNDMTRSSEESWEVRRNLLGEEYRKYMELMEDKAMVLKWFQEMQRKLSQDEAMAIGTFGEGMRAGFAQMKDDLMTLGELGAEVGKSFRDGIVGALNDAIWNARTLKEGLQSVLQAIGEIITQWLLNRAVTTALNTFFPQAHSGGIVGQPMMRRQVNPLMFAGAPRLHNGLSPDEFPAILQRGETVLPASGNNRIVGLLEMIAKKASPKVAVVHSQQELLDFIGSEAGEGAIMKVIQRNRL